MRPLIAIPARFSSSAAALRFEAEVSARKLVEAVYAAGGEPVSIHPSAPGGAVSEEDIAERLGFADRRSFTQAFSRWAGCTPSQYRLGRSG